MRSGWTLFSGQGDACTYERGALRATFRSNRRKEAHMGYKITSFVAGNLSPKVWDESIQAFLDEGAARGWKLVTANQYGSINSLYWETPD